MMSLREAYQQRLAGVSGITDLVSQYKSEPAIFAQDPVPNDASFPYIVVRDSAFDTNVDTKTTIGRMPGNDIGIYGAATGDSGVVETLAELVWLALHRQPVTVSGYGNLVAVATPPIVAPTDDQVYGRVVQVRQMMIKA